MLIFASNGSFIYTTYVAHLRIRHLQGFLEKQAKFWPVVGVLGLRQVGKSTLLRSLSSASHYVTLDDQDQLEDANLSAKNFLAKRPRPLVIDEVQKCPALFDSLKFVIDRERRPGQFLLSGSSQFSSKLGIRESLTGRIGLLYLYPLTLAESHSLEFSPGRISTIPQQKPRFTPEQALSQFSSGSLPVPLFTRDSENVASFLQNWLDATLLRDLRRLVGNRYDPDFALSLLHDIGRAMRDGELPRLAHLRSDARKARPYLAALEDVFVLQKLVAHHAAAGGDAWLPTDTGIATHLMGGVAGEGSTLSLSRVFLLNELRARNEYNGSRLPLVYYRTARGGPVDLVWGNVPIKMSILPPSRAAYDRRPLEAAAKKLGSKRCILVHLREEFAVARSGLSSVPLTAWS